jgi:hypothetical protein
MSVETPKYIGVKHMGRVAALGCVLCKLIGREQSTRTEVHHVREGQGAAQRADDMLTVSLCSDCHRGADGLHGLGTKGFYMRYKMDELDLLALTLRELEP